MKLLFLSYLVCASAGAFAQNFAPNPPDNHQLFVDELDRNRDVAQRERAYATTNYTNPAWISVWDGRYDSRRNAASGPQLPHYANSVIALSRLATLSHKSERSIARQLSARGWKLEQASVSGEGRVTLWTLATGDQLIFILTGRAGHGHVDQLTYSGSNNGLYDEATAALESHAEISDAGSYSYHFMIGKTSVYFPRKRAPAQPYSLHLVL